MSQTALKGAMTLVIMTLNVTTPENCFTEQNIVCYYIVIELSVVLNVLTPNGVM